MLKVHFETCYNRDFGLPGQVPSKGVLSRFWQKLPVSKLKLAQIELLMLFSCYSGKIDPETLFSASHQNLQKIFPKMSQLGLATSEADLAKYPLFSPILGGISKLQKIKLHRIGSKFICSLLGPIPKAEKIFSSNGAFLAKISSNRFSHTVHFGWVRTFKNLKNPK